MRIAVYTKHTVATLRGGAEVMLDEIVKYLRSQGDEVQVIDSGLRDLMTCECDIIISQMSWTNDARMVARHKDVPFVQIMHNDGADSRVEALRGAHLTVCNTNWLCEELEGDFVLHPIVRPDDHATVPGKHVTLVNLIPEKGAVLFYQLAALNPEVAFMGVMGGYGRQLSNVPGVKLVDNTPHMRRDVWQHTRILLVPSTYESYGMAAIEAMCSGIPVIATDTPGLREATQGAAMLMDTRCPQAWNKALHEVQRDWVKWSDKSYKRAAQLRPDDELNRFRSCLLSLL